MPNSFRSQANIVAFNICFNILMQCKPVILSCNQLLGLVNAKMACKKIVVILTDKLRSNDFRNVKEALILKHSFDIYPSFKKLCSLQFFYLIVIILQIWEFKPHSSNTNIIKALVGYFASEKVLKPS